MSQKLNKTETSLYTFLKQLCCNRNKGIVMPPQKIPFLFSPSYFFIIFCPLLDTPNLLTHIICVQFLYIMHPTCFYFSFYPLNIIIIILKNANIRKRFLRLLCNLAIRLSCTSQKKTQLKGESQPRIFMELSCFVATKE